MQVFISYRNLPEYVEWTQKLKDWLENRGYSVWLDRYNIQPGINPNNTMWRRSILEGIRTSQAMLVIYAPECFDRDVIIDEWELGRANGLHIQFLKVKDVPTKDVLPGYVHVQHIDMASNQAWMQVENELLKARSLPKEISADPFATYLRDALETIFILISSKTDDVQVRQLSLSMAETPGHINTVPSSIASHKSPMRVRLFLREGLAGDVEAHESKQIEIQTVTQGMEKVSNRLLLLGKPGSGKTFTLYQYACDMLMRRQSEGVSVPLPIFMICTTWNSSPPQPLIKWVQEYWKGLEHLREEDILHSVFIFDGLDELGAERVESVKDADGKEYERSYDPRLRFLEALPEQGALIVSTRIEEYETIGHKARLNGAVTLIPLTDDQIRAYLEGLPELWQALQADGTLLEVLRTPLLLSLFAFGYQNAPKELRALTALDAGQVSNAVFGQYVTERYNHEERRRAGTGEKMPFSLDKLKNILGKAAMRNASGSYGVQDNVLDKTYFKGVAFKKFTEFAVLLHLLVPIDSKGKTFRFIHLRLRDYFVRAYCLPRIGDPKAYRSYDGGYYKNTPALAVASLPNGEAVDNLLHELNHNTYSNVRESVAIALFKVGNLAIKPLIYALKKDKDSGVRVAISKTLGRIGGVRAVKPLVNALKRDKDNRVRLASAQALGWLGDTRAVPHLVHMLRDEDSDVRLASVEALGWLGDTRAIEPLVYTLKEDEDSNVCQAVANVLEKLGWQPQTVEEKIAWHFARHSWNELAIIGEPAISHLIRALINEYMSGRTTGVAEALGQVGEPAIEHLISELTHTDFNVRSAVAGALGRIGDSRAVEPLIAIIEDEDSYQVRCIFYWL